MDKSVSEISNKNGLMEEHWFSIYLVDDESIEEDDVEVGGQFMQTWAFSWELYILPRRSIFILF